MLHNITPVLLTYNESPNVHRSLSRLTWAKDIVVVDSGSTDDTLEILLKFPQVRLFRRAFDTHGNQWRYAVRETAIVTDWILRLDADYVLSDELIRELAALDPDGAVSAYRIGFDYAIFSRHLRSSLYPPNTILLRRDHFDVSDKGHTEAWSVDGPIAELHGRVIHDDWKPTEHWVNSQTRYMKRELEEIRARGSDFRAWLRLTPPLMPLGVFFYCLFGKGLIADGKAGLFYALQRSVAEAILSLLALEQQLRSSAPPKRQRDRV
jgi:glycosyltransferase involved in cell wall biosynthesis